MRHGALLIALMCSIQILFAQETIWEADLQDELNNVNWIEQSNDGLIIAAGDLGMIGMDPHTGDIQWKNETLKAVDRSTYQNVELLPFVIANYVSGAKEHSVILNSTDGTILFDTGDHDAIIGTHHFLTPITSILFELRQDGRNSLLLFNYETAQVEWTLDFGDAPGFIKTGFSGVSFLRFPPSIMNDSQLLLSEKDKVSVIDYKEGKLLWSNEFDKKIQAAVYSSVDDKVYAGEKKKLKVLQASDGKDVTSGKLKLDGELVTVFPNSNDNLIIVGAKGFSIYDPKSGDFIWKKPYSVDGMYEVLEIDGSYFAFGREEGQSTAAKVDKNGKKIWKEKISGFAYYMVPIDLGIFFLSTDKSNIISYDDGERLWKKDVKFKTIPSVDYDKKAGEVALYSNKEVYKFNLKDGNVEQLTKDLKFEKTKDVIFQMEIRESGYFVYAPQHLSLVDRKGNIKYIDYHDPVTSTNWLRLASDIGSDLSGYDLDIEGNLATLEAMDDLVSRGVYRTGSDQGGTQSEESTIASAQAGDTGYSLAQERYQNSQQSRDAYYVLMKTEDGSNQISMFGKDTGKIEKHIEIKDKSPSYIVDEVNQLVILNENTRNLTCYKMQ